MSHRSRLFVFAFCALTGPAHAADCARPKDLRFEVTGKIVRSEVGFTQGLEWRDGKLFESTGAVGGHSGLNTIAPDGTVTRLRDDGTRYFGEGLTILNDEIYQLTWQEHDVFVYGLDGKLKRTMRNPREGWGLTNDGKSLIFSDGSASFFFADPHELYKHWPPDIWQAIDNHQAKQGMNEIQVSMALGTVATGSGDYGNRTLQFDNNGHPVTVTFANNKATSITEQPK